MIKVCFLVLVVLMVAHGQNEFNHRTIETEDSDNASHGKTHAQDNQPGTDSASAALTDDTDQSGVKEGESSATDVEDSKPVAEKFIGRKRPHPDDLLRQKMIGMIFTGEPQPLGVRPRIDERRRHYRPRPKFVSEFQHDFILNEHPKQILKPMPFIPRPTNVELPATVMHTSASGHPSHFVRGPSPKSHLNLRQNIRHLPPREQEPKPFDHFHEEGSFSAPKHIFSNTVGPDFGPVTFEEFGANFESDFNDFDFPRVPKKPHKAPPRKPNFNPSESAVVTPFGFSNTQFGSFDEVHKFEGFPTAELGPDGCHKYTEDICLDTDDYPHEEILESLASDPTKARTLMAEVKDQSADDLVDGVTADQESKYDFMHYFANRRSDSHITELRDFAENGGYLCPSEVKYARPKKARNSKGIWKFIVNMDKYSQTIRMERCMTPGGSCSYVSHHYRATCSQVYNYQRLLSWEKEKGLHMDIFKVPSCCSCHIQGYAYVFPPLSRGDPALSGSKRIDHFILPNSKDVKSVHLEAPPYSPINYPNLPPEIKSRLAPKDFDWKKEERMTPLQRRPNRRDRDRPIERSGAPLPRVNYDYHPIIDFFEGSSDMK